MKIYWSPFAVERLEQIFDYLAAEDINAARKTISLIVSKIDSLYKFPKRGRVVPEAGRNEIREVFSSDYRIIYKTGNNRITILTIRKFCQMLTKIDLLNPPAE